MHKLLAVHFCCLLVLSMGCSSLQPRTGSNGLTEQNLFTAGHEQTEKKVSNPSRIAVIWSNNVLKTPDKEPIRGFTGRIYFYDNNDELLKVDGELTVYGYDDSQYTTSEVADHVYKFPPDYFAKHYSPSELGHSYAIWVPWPQEDRFRKSISLYPAFKTADGQKVFGNLSFLTLPGDKPPHENHVEKKIVKVGARATVGDSPDSTRPQVDQFNVPYAMAQKLAQQPPLFSPRNRMPSKEVLQHLSDLESNEINPGGAKYNQPLSTNTRPAGKTVESNQASHNISDVSGSSNSPASFLNGQAYVPTNPSQTAPRTSAFGKPGSFR